jgi:hypothetical protein
MLLVISGWTALKCSALLCGCSADGQRLGMQPHFHGFRRTVVVGYLQRGYQPASNSSQPISPLSIGGSVQSLTCPIGDARATNTCKNAALRSRAWTEPNLMRTRPVNVGLVLGPLHPGELGITNPRRYCTRGEFFSSACVLACICKKKYCIVAGTM